MKLAQIVSVIICVFTLSSCCKSAPASTQPQNAEIYTTSVTEINMPDTMKEYADDPRVQWMAGMVVGIENAEMLHGISQESFEVYSNPGDKVNVVVLVQNGLQKTQRFDLMVFADGVPVEFSINGENYNSYSIDLTPWQKMIEIELNTDFVLNMGRLDFIMSYSENPQEDFHLVTYTVWIDLTNEPLQPSNLCSVVDQRAGVEGMYGGGAYNAWFWNEGYIPADTAAVGSRTITIQNEEKILVEAVASRAGQYRTVVVVNGTPVEFEIDGVKHSYLDWESTGTNMLQVPITLLHVPHSGYIYTINTPLTTENRAEFIVASGMVELVPDTEG